MWSWTGLRVVVPVILVVDEAEDHDCDVGCRAALAWMRMMTGRQGREFAIIR